MPRCQSSLMPFRLILLNGIICEARLQTAEYNAGASMADITLRSIYDHGNESSDNSQVPAQVRTSSQDVEDDTSSSNGSASASGPLPNSGEEGPIHLSPSISDTTSTEQSSSDSDNMPQNQNGEGGDGDHGNEGSEDGESNDSSGEEERLDYMRWEIYICVQTTSLNNDLACSYFRNFHELLNNGAASSIDVMLLVESLRTKHHLKEKPFYDLILKIVPFLHILQADGVPSHKTIKRKMQSVMVGVTITFVYRHRATGRLEKQRDMESIPRKKYKSSLWALVYTVAKVGCYM